MAKFFSKVRLGKSFPQVPQQLWREVLPIGLLMAGGVILTRALGWLQIPELMVLDGLMKWRSPEATSDYVVLVGITEEDLNEFGGFPLSDRVLAEALQTLEKAEPRVIGLDLFREMNRDPDRVKLGEYFSESQKLIGAKVALNAEQSLNIPAAPELSSEQVGFVDVLLDPDHKLRRMILASRTWSGELEYSMAMRLAMNYLKSEGIAFSHGDRSTAPIRWGHYQVPRVTASFGGYQEIDANGNQLLLNVSTGKPPFTILTLKDVLSPDFDPRLVRDRAVLVGMTAVSVKDTFYSDAVPHTILTESFGQSAALRSRLYGVEFHAHAAHQLIASVITGRPGIWVLPMWGESLLICVLGLGGIGIGLWMRSPWRSLMTLAIASGGLVLASLGLLQYAGLWFPLLPLSLVLVVTGLSTSFFDRDLRRLLEERKTTIVQTFESVHNGPLQTLALLVRGVQGEQWTAPELTQKLQALNQELRGLYSHMEEAALDGEETLLLQHQEVLSLQPPLDQLLHQVYTHTLERPFPGFESLLFRLAPDFSVLEGQSFSFQEKRSFCLFLEEALNNVGKHGIGSVSLDVSCLVQDKQFILRVINRLPQSMMNSTQTVAGSQGTKQAQGFAKTLGGKFLRHSEGKSYICQLSWPQDRAQSVWRHSLERLLPFSASSEISKQRKDNVS